MTQTAMPKPTPRPETMLAALKRRDPEYDGLFYACVKTTGIFCRPTCRARKPKPENVEFVGSAQEALLRGFRPCKICAPLDPTGAQPAWARKLIEEIGDNPCAPLRDQDLRTRGVDPVKARRHFLKTTGMTFHAYQRALRLGVAMRELRSGAAMTQAAHAGGYTSESGLRDAFRTTFGAPPARAKKEEALVATRLESPLGPLLAVASAKGLCLLEFLDRRALLTEIERLRERFGCVISPGASPTLERTSNELSEYFESGRTTFGVPLDLRGSEYQRRVWARLIRIPSGETESYGAVAGSLAPASSARAVGRATGQNQIAIIVPCHRVVGANGQLTGYGGGLWRKRWLLAHERGERAAPLFTEPE